MSSLARFKVRRPLVVLMVTALLGLGVVGVTTPANAGGMTVVTPRGTVTTYKTGLSISAGIEGFASDGHGGMWFTEFYNAKFGHITSTGTITEYGRMGAMRGIALGPDGNMWMVDQSGGAVVRVKRDGSTTDFTNAAMAVSQPFDITAGPDGAMWVAASGTGQIFRVAMNGDITTFAGSPAAAGITTGPDGALWFADSYGGVYRMTVDGSLDKVVAGLGEPLDIAAGPDGNLWLTDRGAGAVDRVQLDGTVTQFKLPAGGLLWGITAGPDGAMWVSNEGNMTLDRVTMDGHVTSYGVGASVKNSAVAPDGSVWAGTDSSIVRVTTGLAGAPASATAVAGPASATVSWTVPVDSGMNTISSYKVTASPGGSTCITGFTTCLLKGLRNGTAYTFTVQAANSLGLSPAVITTSSVTPRSAPSVPRSIAVSYPKKGSVTVSWKAPALSNGSPVTGYQVKWTIVSSGATTAWTSTAKTALTKAGFQKGQKILVQVRALNSAGAGPIAAQKFTQGK